MAVPGGGPTGLVDERTFATFSAPLHISAGTGKGLHRAVRQPLAIRQETAGHVAHDQQDHVADSADRVIVPLEIEAAEIEHAALPHGEGGPPREYDASADADIDAPAVGPGAQERQ